MNEGYLYTYILCLENEKYYVGRCIEISIRCQQHSKGYGSAWVRKHKPINPIKLLMKCRNNGDNDVDKYVKECMIQYGVNNVRGGSYYQIKLSNSQLKTLSNELIIHNSNDNVSVCGKEITSNSHTKVRVIRPMFLKKNSTKRNLSNSIEQSVPLSKTNSNLSEDTVKIISSSSSEDIATIVSSDEPKILSRQETQKIIESQLIAIFKPLLMFTEVTSNILSIKSFPSIHAENIGEIVPGDQIKAYDIIDNKFKSLVDYLYSPFLYKHAWILTTHKDRLGFIKMGNKAGSIVINIDSLNL